MFQDISVEDLLIRRKNGDLQTVDVRSPSEFRDGTIPGSINIPFFNDEERAEIGTLYTRVSVQAAKDRGLEIASAKLPALVKEFQGIGREKGVFCWRGGMRSRTVATVLSLMGIRVYRLEGGYREYRRWTNARLEQLAGRSWPSYVLQGYTGTGKTAILQALQAEGYPVADLEQMAGHRGSIFGGVGLSAHNQKTFDALLVDRLEALEQAPWIMLEAESRKIGKIAVPEFVMRSKEEGKTLLLKLPLAERARHIVADYQPEIHGEALLRAYRIIKERIHTPIAKDIEGKLLSGAYHDAVMLLLEYYYDPLYSHSAGQYEEEPIVVAAETVAEALDRVRELLPPLGGSGL
ncbi:tRNA 2-selenouridine(34) synthase MnmH [Paenibacillus sp. YN15]|uniref:tRNA 2-selenouridine(34) synthase MnmH n=1 Tax=Paenibacillus sp. YN15 TaxID=1742774 RepID=UPI000DCE61F4|nr:tRNA 2-selenouridine(34) synthase MnmH [Paenibacillus sp. YN15]RAU92101.1 tRNA 2-selenouridine(34) synthase MnmH [Paenibacillus sp. YN15]